MANDEKLEQRIRARMERTGEDQATARMHVLATPSASRVDEDYRPTHRFEDRRVGKGATIRWWHTLTVAYETRREGQVLERRTDPPFVYLLVPYGRSWMQQLLGMRVGGIRRVIQEPAAAAWPRAAHLLQGEADTVWIDAHVREAAFVRRPILGATQREGSGPPAVFGDRVRVVYTLVRGHPGTRGETIHQTHEPVELELGDFGALEGVHRACLGMKAGAVRTATLPPHLAWGDARPEGIGPDEAVTVVAELLAITRSRDAPDSGNSSR